jgi:glyoxylase-like metal-dependent hydrolase (beta-lactamase superfamily II)
MRIEGFDIDILVQGFPGKSVCHGGLGWSTVVLLRGQGRVVLVDTGSFNMRRLILDQLARRELVPADVTDVLLTHAHYDHSINWIMFPNARVVIGADELDWAAAQPIGHSLVPELYIRDLALSPKLRVVGNGEEVFPGMTAYTAPGHTPGHLIFFLSAPDRDVIFTGDAAKNRAELISGTADMSMDESASVRSIARIFELWRKRADTILVPGHDIPMVLGDGRPIYIEARRAGITAWFDDDLEQTTLFELKAAEPSVARRAASQR